MTIWRLKVQGFWITFKVCNCCSKQPYLKKAFVVRGLVFFGVIVIHSNLINKLWQLTTFEYYQIITKWKSSQFLITWIFTFFIQNINGANLCKLEISKKEISDSFSASQDPRLRSWTQHEICTKGGYPYDPFGVIFYRSRESMEWLFWSFQEMSLDPHVKRVWGQICEKNFQREARPPRK